MQSVRVSDESCARIKAAGEQYDIALSVHAPYYINLNATEEMWQAGRERLLAAARCGYKAGATDIIFHPGSYMKGEPRAACKIALERLSEVADTLKTGEVQGDPAAGDDGQERDARHAGRDDRVEPRDRKRAALRGLCAFARARRRRLIQHLSTNSPRRCV